MAIEHLMDARVRLLAEEAMASMLPPSRQSHWRLDEWHITVLVAADGVWRDVVHKQVTARLIQKRSPKPIMEGPMCEMRPALEALTLEASKRGRYARTSTSRWNTRLCQIPVPVLTASDDPEDLRVIYHDLLAVRLTDTVEVAWAAEPTPHLAPQI